MVTNDGGHDIIVIGASAGGVGALRTVLAGLPAEIPAAIFVVVHIGESSSLAAVLGRNSGPRVAQATGGEPIRPGRCYVAGPGAHLLLHDGHVLVRRGPRENMARPAIDPLFRSAAASFGGRVVGVVLSGALNDGTAGLLAIKRCGGLAVVQEPGDAEVPDMPESALRRVEIDHVVAVAKMPDLLGRLVRQPAGESPAAPLDIRLEAAIAAQDSGGMETNDRLGAPSRFTCPECQGALWEIEDAGLLRYRCHLGHAHTAETALVGRDAEIERLLQSLLRSHQERAALARRLADRENIGRTAFRERLDRRARDYQDDVEVVRRLLTSAHASRERADGNEVNPGASKEPGREV